MNARDSTYVVVLASPDVGEGELSLLSEFGCLHPVIAVDGGYAWCMRAGVPVSHVLGDFDSLGYVPDETDACVHPCRKDKTDCELALDFAHEIGAEEVIVFAAFGGRLDHEMSVIQLLARTAERGCKVTAYGNDVEVHVACGPAVVHMPARQTGTVSILSLSEHSEGVTIEGLDYPLEDAVITNRTSLCLSNEFIGMSAAISVEVGTLAIVVTTQSA